MRSGARLFLLVLSCFLLLAASPETEQPLNGYSAATSRTQRDWETKFRAVPEPQNLRDYMQRLSARPHHVGSPYDKDNAEWMLAKFKEWGLDANIETFYALFPTPKVRVVELLEPTKFTAKLQEPALAIDPTSDQQAEQLPTYNAYSADGDVTAPLVYVNYGIPDDYEKLERMGVSVKGAIVIARYGNSWRGIKPKVAAEHGAVGCLIYSDPSDDGYTQGDVFPTGGMASPRRRAARQRGRYAALSRRSAHARSRSHEGRQASRLERCQDSHQDSRTAHFLRGCATTAGGAQRARWLPTAGAAPWPRLITSAPARRRFISKCNPTGTSSRCMTSS